MIHNKNIISALPSLPAIRIVPSLVAYDITIKKGDSIRIDNTMMNA